jgi:SAM-dependent methyltransferase
MSTPPPFCDRAALLRARARARRRPVGFLHELARAELEERLDEVKRFFTTPALITGLPEFWEGFLPDAPRIADEPVLDLSPASHDLIVHALCLHWAADPVGQIIQCTRALRPDGLFLAVMFGGQTLAALRACLAEAEIATSGGLSPRIAPMGEVRDLGALLQRAGLALPVADVVPVDASYPSLAAIAQDLRGMGETNALAERLRRPAPRNLFQIAESRYCSAFASADGRLPVRFDLVFLTGWAPHEAQPQPLRPGSARARLADALGTMEFREDGRPGTLTSRPGND